MKAAPSGASRGGAPEWLLVGALFVVAAVYYSLQARTRPLPWVFPDELRYAEAARAVADTGSASVRGEFHLAGLLQSYLLAPAWLLERVSASWEALKLINAVVFSTTVVPVYLLARRVGAAPAASILAAAAAVAFPSAFYIGTLLQEPIAYPLAATAALLTVLLIEKRTIRVGIALAVVLTLACLARGQLVILPAAASLAIWIDWTASCLRSRRVDRRLPLAALAIAALAALAVPIFQSKDVVSSAVSELGADPARAWTIILASAGSAVAGVVVLPALAAVASLSWLGATNRALASFAAAVAGLGITFLVYPGLKAASLGYPPIAALEERNLIYLAPLGCIALVSPHLRPSRALVAGSSVLAIVVIAAAKIEQHAVSAILSENPGISWVWRVTRTGTGGVTAAFMACCVLGGLVLIGSDRRWRIAGLGTVLVLSTVSTSLLFSWDRGSSQLFARWLSPTPSWVDAATRGQPTTMVVSPDIADLSAVFHLGFWNRSITNYASVGPVYLGLAGAVPDLARGGELPGSPSFVLHTRDQAFEGKRQADNGSVFRLTELRPGHNQLSAVVSGRQPDGWAGRELTIRRLHDGSPGIVSVVLSGDNPHVQSTRTVTVRGGLTGASWRVPPGTVSTLRVRVGRGPFELRYLISPATPPSSYGASDSRPLSLLVGDIRMPDGLSLS